MDIKQLNTFRTVATLGSFNQAADMLNYAQSTVSDQIKALEKDLNVTLFNRDKKKISLTPAGELFLQYAQKIINLDEEIRTEIQESDEIFGSLSIRIPETISTYYLPAILKNFQDSYPHVELLFNSCSSHGLYEELRSGITNLAFLITSDFHHHDLETYTLNEVPLAMVTYPNNPIIKKSCVRLIDLKDEPIFATITDCNYFNILAEYFTSAKIKFKARYSINSINAIKKNIIGQTGVAMLPQITVQEEISKGSLIQIPFEKDPLSAKIIMIWLKNRWHPPILEAFMDKVKNFFK